MQDPQTPERNFKLQFVNVPLKRVQSENINLEENLLFE